MKTDHFSSWGRFPKITAETFFPTTITDCTSITKQLGKVLPRGLGRSYGDSALAQNLICTNQLNHFLSFDPVSGVLDCLSGTTLEQILETFVPKGFFLPVTPGTQFVTVGGAIASDIHGKNHHVDGTFCDHVLSLKILLGSGEILTCSPESEADLFHATCGGMGLTGIILSAKIRLKTIASSDISQTTIKSSCLEEALEQFEKNAGATYSVAWIDCLAKGKNLGRSILMLGEHATSGPLVAKQKKTISVPFDFPSFTLNSWSVKAFNFLYYEKTLHEQSSHTTHYAPFFYPLDGVNNWNRLYGKPGFLQYQFVLPKAAGLAGLKSIIEQIANSGRGSFLAVLKVFGTANQNTLSFPLEGYTLALDFKAEPAVFDLLDKLDQLVLNYGGRLYLTKDARMSEATFKQSYPRWEEFQSIRAKYHALGKFVSVQSKRLGLS